MKDTNKTNKKKRGGAMKGAGRPSKLPKFLVALKQVVQDERTVILTDMELLTLVNDRLPLKDRVCQSTFEFWKSPTKNDHSPESLAIPLKDGVVEDFRHTLGLARVHQKMNLGDKLTDPTSRNAYGAGFILERKFEDMRKNNGIQIGAGGITLTIEGGSDVQNLIDTIDVDFQDVTDQKKLDK